MVTANSRKTRPTTPPISSTGMNTATSEKVIERMVKAISFEPLIAASNGFMPVLDMARNVLEHDDRVVDDEADRKRDRQQRDVVDRIAEQKHEAAAPISDTGKASAGMSVAAADFRNTKMTITTRTIEISSVHCTSAIDWRIETERSLRTRTSTAGGSCD